MQYFVQENSIVRKIWGKSDMVLFIFVGAAAEFALNKAVDWLLRNILIPSDYKDQVNELDVRSGKS